MMLLNKIQLVAFFAVFILLFATVITNAKVVSNHSVTNPGKPVVSSPISPVVPQKPITAPATSPKVKN